MKKTTLGILIWLIAGFSFTALADLPKNGYFHLKVVRIGQQVDTAYLAISPDNPDSLVLLKSGELMTDLDNLDYSLWSFTVKVSAVGQNAYEIANKRGLKFALDEPTTPIKGDDPGASNEALAMLQPEGALELWNDISIAKDTFSLQSYLGGAKYQLSLLGNDSITIASTSGNKESRYLFFTTEKPKERWMTAGELNAKLGDGFKLFFYYQNAEVTSGLKPAINGMKFIADTTNTFLNNDSIFFLQSAYDISPKKKFLYVDTSSYLVDTTKLIYGRKMCLIYDTLPSSFSSYSKPGFFSFKLDPGSKDSVAVFVHGSYGRDTIANIWKNQPVPNPVPAIKNLIPLQLDLSGTTYNLVTDTIEADFKTRIAFKEIAYPTKLRRGKVYAVKVLNHNVNQNHYWVSSLKGGLEYWTEVNDRLPRTQFIYEGYQLVNRDSKNLTTHHLYKISETADIYVNALQDTFEINEMVDVNKHSYSLSFAEIKGSLLKENYLIDIMSGGFAGKVIGMRSDSVVSILDDELKYFSISPAHEVRSYGAADRYVNPNGLDSISEQKRQSYFLKSIEKDEYIWVDTLTNRLIMTTKDSTAFYMRNTPNGGREYILIPGNKLASTNITDDTLKVQVNSQSGSLELVDIKVNDNYFRVRPESDIATYKKDAKGYYEFASYLEQRLTKNASDYAVYRNEGDPILKSSGQYVDDDFKLYLEPALTTGIYANKPSYYIVKDADLGADEKEIAGYFLHVLDSGKVTDPTPYQVEIGGLYYNRLNFVKGKRFSGDSILVNYESASQTKADSIGYKGKNEWGIKEYRFFLRETDVLNEYMLVAELGFDGQGNEDGYLSVLNDVLFISPRSSAYTVRVTKTDPPVSNDNIVDNEIKVISEKGAITLLNAAGKSVSIVNILGNQLKSMYVSSDQERIELPQGIVIVNVAGERAIKALVK